MLNRNAEALFWVGRYMERAENHARLIDVHYHLLPEERADGEEAKAGAGAGKWTRIVDALGSRDNYEQLYDAYTEGSVLRYVTLEREHANSLYACVNHARGNLRTLREKLPTELWEVVNAFYLWLRDQEPEALLRESPHQLFVRVKEWAALFLGTAESVMPRENEWHFMACGRYLERVENTLRILLSVGHAADGDAAERYPYLQAVLKSVSGYQAFRRYYAEGFSEAAIIEFMLLHSAFPRSVQFAMQALGEHLKGLELQEATLKSAHGKLVRQVGRMAAELSCLEREDMAPERDGLVLSQLLNGCERLGAMFAQTFFRLGEASA